MHSDGDSDTFRENSLKRTENSRCTRVFAGKFRYLEFVYFVEIFVEKN